MDRIDDGTEPRNGAGWHARTVADVLEALQTAADGLSADEARARLARHGPNRLPSPPRRSALARLLAQVDSVLIYVLLAAGAVTALLGHWLDTAVILAVVVVNTVIGFVQEGRAEHALDAIRHLLAPKASVLRGGRRRTVPGEELVPGDVVLLEAGDRVPADLRLLQCRGLRVEEAILTGESVPVEKGTDPVAADAALGDRSSIAFSGTMVRAGQGRGVVVATGAETEIGRISALLATVEKLETPLVRKMSVFAKYLTVAILGFAALIFAWGHQVQGYPFRELFMAVVGLAVAAIPEGLPAILTVTLAIGVQRMARRNAIVRRLPAIETLGSVSVICSDKTGTLTRNEMTVATVALPGRTVRVSGVGYVPEGDLIADNEAAIAADDVPGLRQLVRAALLCNDASLVQRDGEWLVEGDPMEGALVVLAHKAGLDPDDERARWRRRDVLPFAAEHRFMATCDEADDGTVRVFVKGAPERLIDACRSEFRDGEEVPLDPAAWHERAEAIARDGQRVLALAMAEGAVELEGADLPEGLRLLGLVGLIDPAREEAIRAVAECQRAGITVKMITGDHAATAAAIGRTLGLERADTVLVGHDIDALDDDALGRRVLETDVFARTSPEHKLRLVEALQAHGAVVAMTGDGVNDAPALKRADIGIAMGLTGSEAAKEAAEMVLADDNFHTLAEAVRAGRTVYDNLTKAIVFLLPVNAGEAMVMVAAILLGIEAPITPLQILWVNMVSSVALAMALAFEPPEPSVMRRPPRDPGAPLLSGLLVWRIAFVGVLFGVGIFATFAVAKAQGLDLAHARTLSVNTLVALEVAYLFSVRYLNAPSLTWQGVQGTPAVLVAIAAVALLQGAFTYLPPMMRVFDTAPLGLVELAELAVVAACLFVLLEVEKAVRRRFLPVSRATGCPSPGPRSGAAGRR